MSDERAASRRDFLKLSATAAPAAAVTLVASTGTTEAAVADQGEGLRRTDHVEKYLASARF